MAAPISNEAVDRWVARNIISAEQRNAILQDLAEHSRHSPGLNLTTLLYYGGGLLVLIAYSIFLGLQWADMNHAARIAISALSLVFFGAAAQLLLRDRQYQLPGELLQVVAVAIIPLLVFAVLDAAGVWPHEPGRQYPYTSSDDLRRQYQLDLTWARMGLAGATIAGAFVAFRLSRSPFLLVTMVVALISLFLDASIQVEGSDVYYDWRTAQALVVAVTGAAVFAAGVLVRGRTERDYSLWLLVTGLAALATGLGSLAFPDNAPGWGALWMIGALIVLALAIPLQERLLAAAGLAAIFAYCAKLVFDVFESASAALAMAALGLVILGVGLLYQRLTAPRIAAA